MTFRRGVPFPPVGHPSRPQERHMSELEMIVFASIVGQEKKGID